MNPRTSPRRPAPPQAEAMPNPGEAEKSGAGERQIPIHGYKQIVDMLRVADPAFRHSLLRRIAARDRELANALARDLANI